MAAETTTETPVVGLVDRLREDVLQFAGRATLTCTFVPGGKLDGAGIRSHLYCADCGQARVWHDVADAAAALEGQPLRAPAPGERLQDRLRATLAGRQN